ncbi:hypothetical protein BH11GEM1_BH11GEM1_04590 [soil metagenome]
MSDASLTQPSTDSRLARARVLARALDSAVGIPGTKVRFGLDPIIGLVPGLGDLAGAALSGYIVLVGIQLGASRSVVLRMLANVAIDTAVGAVPVVGDLFDAGWKSNNRNVALIERHVAAPGPTRTSSRLMIGLVVLVLLLLAAGSAAVTVLLIRWLMHH